MNVRFVAGFLFCCLGLAAVAGAQGQTAAPAGGGNVLSVVGSELRLNGHPIKLRGLRTSAALISDASTKDLIEHLDVFRSYGVNAISVYVMGSRFADVKGYRPDASLDETYAARLARIIEAADRRGMVVLVGCLYWSTSRAKEELAHWTQADANRAVANTVTWLRERNHRNVFVDPDNEGMAHAEKHWDIGAMIEAGHAADPQCLIAYNSKAAPPPAAADLAIHHSPKIAGKPYVETEGSPRNLNYWGEYSRGPRGYNYLNVGLYTAEMKSSQQAATAENIERWNGYFFAATWLQAPPPLGPNMKPGGDGSAAQPGIRWWLEFLRERYAR